jgi:nucleotide-binding universal stress UspA family protein
VKGLDRIVVGYNATDACATALRLASALAKRCGGALEIASVGIPVVPVGGFGWITPYDPGAGIDELVRERVAEAAARVDEGVPRTTHALFGMPAAEIVEIARSRGAALIVVGAARRSALERVLVGSTAERVVRLTDRPVLVAASPEPPRRILVGIDESPFGEAALRAALALAAAAGATVRCVHVVPEPAAEGALVAVRGRVREFVAAAARGAPSCPECEVRAGPVCDRILEEAAACGADLVAIGSHGRGFVGRAILGSTSEALMRRAPVSLLVAPGPSR